MAINQTTTRIQNKRRILEALMHEGDMSRAGLAKHLGLSKPAIAENVEGLIESGLVVETGEGAATSRGGRKPRLLHFQRDYQTIATVDLHFEHPVIAIGDLSGEMLCKKEIYLTMWQQTAQGRIDAVVDAIEGLLASTRAGPGRLGIIIVSTPGVFLDNNLPLYGAKQLHGWSDIGLDKALEHVFHVPVLMKNYANVAALGAFTVGRGKGCRNMIYVSSVDEFDMGLIIDGKLYEGRNNAAGRMSSFVERYNYQGASMEAHITTGSLLTTTQKDVERGAASTSLMQTARQKGRLALEDIALAAQNNDPYAMEKLQGMGRVLGFLLSAVSCLLDTDRIIFGDGYVCIFDTLRAQIETVLYKCISSPPQLVPSILGDEAGLYGGFIFGRDRLFTTLQL